MARFTVDTHLFRELGALLVGRDSTALVELIKNSYDADSPSVQVYGEALDDPERGFIRLSDGGVGMTSEEFNNGFLRIASRSREEGSRISKRYGRRFTGAKGIGRLAAHKLGRVIDIYSVSDFVNGGSFKQLVEARIDWDAVEQKQTLDELDDNAVTVQVQQAPPTSTPGTVITLRKLRGRWTQAQRGQFLGEVQTFEPPPILTSPLKRTSVESPILFDEPTIRQTSNNDPGFLVQLDGEFASGDEYWQTLVDVAGWVVEINAPRDGRSVRCAIVPTSKTLLQYPAAQRQVFKLDHPDPERGPFFQARILVREGTAKGSTSEKAWSRRAAGIRVFMEGFRVLPYGEPKDDWLSLDADYARRSRSLASLDNEETPPSAGDTDEGLLMLPNRQYFGAVFLTQKSAPSLKMLVNREGFVPDNSFQDLVALVRKSIDLTTRVRASTRIETRRQRKERRSTNAPPDQTNTPEELIPLSKALHESLERAIALAKDARKVAAAGDIARATNVIGDAINELDLVGSLTEDLLSEVPMIRVLASVGTQMAAFIHEVQGLLGMAQSLDAVISRLQKNSLLPRSVQSEIARIHGLIVDLRRNLERQASYLVDVVTPDARRRRSRQYLSERFDAGRRLIEHIAERRSIKISNNIPNEMKSPPMFKAELTTIFANLLTNAVKAAGEGGRINAQASRLKNGNVRLVIENTGAEVDAKKGERWFRPFESTTLNIDPVLGQGMGLGLPITRNMLEEYGAEIHFVTPSRGFSAAIEIMFPE